MPVARTKLPFRGLNRQFFIYFLMFSYVPLFIFSIFGYLLNKGIVREVHEENLIEFTRLRAERIQEYFAARKDIIRSVYVLSKSPHNGRGPQTVDQLQSSLSELTEFEAIGIIAGDRAIPVRNLTTDILHVYDKAIFSNDLIYVPSLRLFLLKVELDTNLRVLFSLSRAEVDKLLSIADSSFKAQFISRAQRLRFDIKHEEPQILTDSRPGPRPDFALTNIFADTAVVLNAIVPVTKNCQLYIERSVQGVYQELRAFLLDIIAANIFIGLLMFVIAVVLSRRITNPIHQLVLATNKISQGDLSQPIAVESKDEIKLLADEFENMRQKLNESYSNLESKIENRTRELREAQFQISHQEKMASLGLMAAGVAHEIGNPLTSISSMAQIIKRRVKDIEIVDYLNTILKNIERISKIVRELVDFARPSSYETTFVDINELIRNAVGIVKYDRRAKYAQIDLQLDENLPTVYLVADQLLQVFINILINAVDAIKEEEGKITIRSFLNEDRIHIYFSDTGSGIPKENLNKIFEPFFTTKKVGKGTGLGLSVSYGIIKNFNGSISVNSTFGQGSTFKIELPVQNTGADNA